MWAITVEGTQVRPRVPGPDPAVTRLRPGVHTDDWAPGHEAETT
jgi:hypothetical protein